MKLEMRAPRIATLFVGLLFIAAGIYIYVTMSRSISVAREASGVVTEIIFESGVKKGRMHPVVSFKTPEGELIVGKALEHHNLKVGEVVHFTYNPSRPDDIDIGSLSRLKRKRLLYTLLSVLMGLGVCVMSVFFDAEKLEWRWG